MDKNSPRRRPRPIQSRRPPTSTYYRSGKAETSRVSPFEARVKKVEPFKKFWGRTVDLLLVALLVYLLIHSLIVRPVAKVIVDNTSYHSQANYNDSVNSYLRALRDNNKVTFNGGGVVANLKRDYPEVDAAAVELPVLSQKPVVRVSVSSPSFYLKSAGRDYLIDSNGRVVADRWQYPDIRDLAEVVDQSGYSVSRGKQVLSQHDVAFIKDLQAYCKNNKISIKQLVLPLAAEELDLITTDQNYYVKFYLAGDPINQIGQFLASRHEFAQKDITPDQYLDVRISGKIFYK